MITIRTAAVRDAEDIAAVHFTSWDETYRGLMPDAMIDGFSIEKRAAMWRDALERDPQVHSVYVATDYDGRIIGFAAGGPGGNSDFAADGEVYALYVLRAAQRRGTGRALMAALAARLLERGHFKAGLWVLRDNASGRGFYERLGARLIGEKTDEGPEWTLIELAYGWDDLRSLVAPSAAACSVA